MSVVKTLALGVSILGSIVAPTQGGSIRSRHQVPDRPRLESSSTAPTSLVIASPTRQIHASAENLANLGGFLPMQSYASALTYYTSGYTRPAASLNISSAVPALSSTALPVAAAEPDLTAARVASFAPVATPYVAPAVVPTFAPQAAAIAPVAAGHTVDAFVNFGNAPYSEAQSLTTGNAQAWYQSPSATSVFGGVPTAAQQVAFQNEVLQTVQNTYNQSGLKISLTTDPTQNYAHTMSVVSGTSFTGNTGAIGITDVGNDGFSFIDKINLAKTPDELASAVGHNIAHELMHAFGISGHPDQTGMYLDAATANWSTLTNAQTTFSPQAIQMLSAQNFLNGPGKNFTQGALGLTGLEMLTEHHPTFCHCPLCNQLHKLEAAEGLAVAAAPVPEPTTVALWGFAAAAVAIARRRSQRRSAVQV